MLESLNSEQQQGFARIGGQTRHMVLGAAGQDGIGLTKRRTRTGPHKMEGVKKGNLGACGIRNDFGLFKQRFKRCNRVEIARTLVASQSPGVAAQVWQACGDGLYNVRSGCSGHQ
jgi:hypothetical protein